MSLSCGYTTYNKPVVTNECKLSEDPCQHAPHGMESHHKRKHLVGISGAVNVRPDSESEDRQIHTNDYKCCAN